MRKVGSFYWHRGDMAERFGPGWFWVEEACRGMTTGIPIYKALVDVKNAIDKHMDGTNKAEPRIVGTAGWSKERGWYVE